MKKYRISKLQGENIACNKRHAHLRCLRETKQFTLRFKCAKAQKKNCYHCVHSDVLSKTVDKDTFEVVLLKLFPLKNFITNNISLVDERDEG